MKSPDFKDPSQEAEVFIIVVVLIHFLIIQKQKKIKIQLCSKIAALTKRLGKYERALEKKNTKISALTEARDSVTDQLDQCKENSEAVDNV